MGRFIALEWIAMIDREFHIRVPQASVWIGLPNTLWIQKKPTLQMLYSQKQSSS